jgi:rhodanese-related sulfurtransferase
VKQFSTFITDHWLLFLALVVILALLIMSFIKSRFLGFKEIKPAEVVQLLNHNDAIVIDVRDDKEYSEGHILNAVHVPLGVLEGRLNELEKYRARHVIVACNAGQQSARAGMIMQKQGFTNLYKLAGGMRAWQSAHLPVTRN